MLSAAVSRLLSHLPQAGPSAEAFDEVAPRILPRPVGPGLLTGLAAGRSLLSLPFVGTAKLCFVVRYEGRARYVRAGELEGWGISAAELRAIAIRNLAARSERAKLASIEGDGGSFVLARTGDGLDAARALLPGLATTLAAELGSPFALAIPHRDTLLACRIEDRASLEQLAARARDLAARAPHAILSEVLRVDPDGSLSVLTL
jgi:uncharacterized protein YtpQ (UPF0354 family)